MTMNEFVSKTEVIEMITEFAKEKIDEGRTACGCS